MAFVSLHIVYPTLRLDSWLRAIYEMDVGFDLSTFLQNNSLYELSETLACKFDAFLYETLKPLKTNPLAYVSNMRSNRV